MLKGYDRADLPTFISILTSLLTCFFLMIFLISDSGYIQPKSINDQDNALYLISNEIDDHKSVDNLT
jgi:hypothetical protein